MTKSKPVSRAARLEELRRESAKLYGVKVSDNDVRVTRRATFALALEAETAKLVEGQDANVAAMLQLEEALKALTPPEQIKVTLDIVDGVTGIFDCQHCGKRNDIPDYRAPPPQSNPVATPASGESSPTTPANGSGGIVAKPEVKAASVPLPPPPPPAPRNPSMAAWERATGRGYSRSSRDGGPVRFGTQAPVEGVNYNNAEPMVWSGYAGRPSNLTPADPHPYQSPSGGDRHHPLPSPQTNEQSK